jgi:hypothetical protein
MLSTIGAPSVALLAPESATPRLRAGSVKIDKRAQAVPPTRMAPTIVTAHRPGLVKSSLDQPKLALADGVNCELLRFSAKPYELRTSGAYRLTAVRDFLCRPSPFELSPPAKISSDARGNQSRVLAAVRAVGHIIESERLRRAKKDRLKNRFSSALSNGVSR